MDGLLIAIVGLLLVGTLAMAALYLGIPIPGITSGTVTARSTMQTIVASQRNQTRATGKGDSTARTTKAAANVEDIASKKSNSAKLTLKKKLRYAQWHMTPLVFYLCEASISLLAFVVAFVKFNIAFQVVSFFAGPMFMGWLLMRAVDKRVKMFDSDYPSYLLSIVSLIKTGMNVMTALDAAAKGLEEGSIVRTEIELMIERLRYGVTEEKSIGTFAEDVNHPEIELFVQALLLSRRVGGTLSDTLERLSKQVRRRQFFRASAQAAVSMQRGSIWFILMILVGIEAYLYVVYPQAVTGAIKDPMGWQIYQVSVLLILAGMYWVRQVTKIRM